MMPLWCQRQALLCRFFTRTIGDKRPSHHPSWFTKKAKATVGMA